MKTKINCSLILCCFAVLCAGGPLQGAEKPAGKSKARVKASRATSKSKSSVSDELLKEYETEDKEKPTNISDPWKPWNKAWFRFNDKFYFWVLKPVSTGYKYLLYPRFIRFGIENLLDNLGFPGRFLNSWFQGRALAAGEELARFLINSTLGVVGLWEPSRYWFHLEEHSEDFDQTLGVWGLGTGIYLTWPIFGPSSVRGTFGLLGDFVTNPISNSSYGYALNTINSTSLGHNNYETLLRAAVDPYVAIRDAYVQNRVEEIAR
jgi:phospholipid-binding lipoprotein MlaA